MIKLTRAIVAMGLLLAVLGVVACQGTTAPTLYPVSGRVMLGNNLVTRGTVMYYPDYAGGSRYPPTGTIQPDGTYTLYTDGRLGAPRGKYRVTITPIAPTADIVAAGKVLPPNVPTAYSEPDRSKLRVEVVDLPVAGRYDLQLYPGGPP